MWAPILANFFHMVFIIFGFFGAYQFRAKYLISVSLFFLSFFFLAKLENKKIMLRVFFSGLFPFNRYEYANNLSIDWIFNFVLLADTSYQFQKIFNEQGMILKLSFLLSANHRSLRISTWINNRRFNLRLISFPYRGGRIFSNEFTVNRIARCGFHSQLNLLLPTKARTGFCIFSLLNFSDRN